LAQILIIDDDPDLLNVCSVGLGALGHDVRTAETGKEGVAEAAIRAPDVIVLDLGLPDLDGLEVCRQIRVWSSVPIIVLSADGSEDRKVDALDDGADDYMTKPFGVQEFIARVEALIRRAERPPRPSTRPERVRLGDFVLDAAARRVVIGDREVKMSPREFNLLFYLLEHAGKVHSREALLRSVWGADFHGDNKTVAVHIRWLREKFEAFPTMPFRISTVFGVGYRIDLAPGIKVER
jgi:two-component system KDP operon response regulator KdpE